MIIKIKTIKDMFGEPYDKLYDNLFQEVMGDEGFVIHTTKKNQHIFLEAYGAPGDNSAGYGIYYNTKTKHLIYLFENSDDDIIPIYKPVSKSIIKYKIWRNKQSCNDDYCGPFHVIY